MTAAPHEMFGVGFEVVANVSALQAHLDELFAACEPLPPGRSVDHRFEIASSDVGFEVSHNGRLTAERAGPTVAVNAVVGQTNRIVLDAVDGLGLHAGVVGVDGVRIVLCGASESGKSTITTAMCRAGAHYGSDEAIVFGWGDVVGVPFPKPISLDPGSWPLFPDLEPDLGVDEGEAMSNQWQVAPRRVGEVDASPSAPHLVVFREYRPGAPTEVTSVTRAELIAGLARETHRLRDHRARALEQLEVISRQVAAVRVTGGDLDEAVAAVAAAATHLPAR